MNKLTTTDWIALILIIVGGLNWGLVGLLNLNLVTAILGDMTIWSRIVYVLVGLSGIYLLAGSGKLTKK